VNPETEAAILRNATYSLIIQLGCPIQHVKEVYKRLGQFLIQEDPVLRILELIEEVKP
jgi:hypothetical protein